MERRDFIAAALALAFAPASARAENPHLVDLEKQMREHFGDDAEEIIQTAHGICLEVINENPDLDRKNEENLERLRELLLAAIPSVAATPRTCACATALAAARS